MDLTVWALRRRDRNRIDRWDGSYRRVLNVAGEAMEIQVTQHGTAEQPLLTVTVEAMNECTSSQMAEVRGQARRLLGVDVDLKPFYALAQGHPLTKDLTDRLLGVRPPVFPTLFEALCNAVSNQQLSVEVGLTLLNRLSEALGSRTSIRPEVAAFPESEAILASSPTDLRSLGFSGRKVGYLLEVAHGVQSGAVDEDSLRVASREEATEQLMAIPGIGRWSAEYVLLRGLGRLDVFPGDDVGARNKIRKFLSLDHPPGYEEIAEWLQPWQPYAGMLYFHLLLDGLIDRGDLVLGERSRRPARDDPESLRSRRAAAAWTGN